MKRILRDSLIYVCGEIFVKVFPFILLPILSRALGPEQYGQISLFNAYVSFFFICIGLNTSIAIVKYEYSQKTYSVADYFYSSLIMSSISLFILSLIFFLFIRDGIIVFAVICAYFQCIYTNLISISQSKKEAKKYLVAQIFNAVFSFAITIILLFMFQARYELRVYSIILGFVFSIFFSFYLNREWLNKTAFNIVVIKRTCAQLFIFGVPLIIHNLSFLVRSGLDRVMIDKFYSKEALGNYSAAFQICLIITVVLTALSNATTPHVYSKLERNSISEKSFNIIFIGYFSCCTLITFLALSLPESLYNLIAGEEYTELKKFVIIMTPAFLSQGFYLIMASTCFFYGRNKSVSYCTFVGGAVHCFLLYLVCKFLNVYYIPWVLLFSNLFVAFIMYVIIFRGLLASNRRGVDEC